MVRREWRRKGIVGDVLAMYRRAPARSRHKHDVPETSGILSPSAVPRWILGKGRDAGGVVGTPGYLRHPAPGRNILRGNRTTSHSFAWGEKKAEARRSTMPGCTTVATMHQSRGVFERWGSEASPCFACVGNIQTLGHWTAIDEDDLTPGRKCHSQVNR